MKNKVIIFLLVAIATITNAQNIFTAKVLDSNNNEVLINNGIYIIIPKKKISKCVI